VPAFAGAASRRQAFRHAGVSVLQLSGKVDKSMGD
jgi:hypothetical protein